MRLGTELHVFAGKDTLSLEVPASNATSTVSITLLNLHVFVEMATLETGLSALPVILPAELALAQGPTNAPDAPTEP